MTKLRNWIRENYPRFYAVIRMPRAWYRPTSKDLLARRLKYLLNGKPGIFFVQIGSNDGLHNDPIRKLVLNHPDWQGIFVEPVPGLYERLVNNYKFSSRFIFENVAIGETSGVCEFHFVSEAAKKLPDLPGWYDQLGSFNKEHILKHFDGKLAPFIVSQPVTTLPLGDLLARHHVKKLDLLHIDTEGFDYKVLSTLDFSIYHPRVILYEHEHLSIDEKAQALALMRENGYITSEYGGDTIASPCELL
jgi:FkbM family methyltransferase